jgi:chromatin remodeling complex protein RSC6
VKKGNNKNPGKTLKILKFEKYPSEFEVRSTKLNKCHQYKFTKKNKKKFLLIKLEHEITESYMKINAAKECKAISNSAKGISVPYSAKFIFPLN